MAGTAATASPAPGALPGAGATDPDSWAALTDDERNALGVVAKVYEVAASKKALAHLPKWMKKYRPPKKTGSMGRKRAWGEIVDAEIDLTQDEDSNVDEVVKLRREDTVPLEADVTASVVSLTLFYIWRFWS